MNELNCWEFKKCGLEPGGARTAELGVCPAATAFTLNGMNEGSNGGRICWFVAGTMCDGDVQTTVAKKFETCLKCDFYDLVKGQ